MFINVVMKVKSEKGGVPNVIFTSENVLLVFFSLEKSFVSNDDEIYVGQGLVLD